MHNKLEKNIAIVLPPAHKYLCINSYTIRSYAFSIRLFLAKKGLRPFFMDFLEDEAGFKKFSRSITKNKATVSTYIVVVFFSNRIESLKLVKLIKAKHAEGVRVVLSGPFAAINHEYIIMNYPADIIVMREPEDTIFKMLSKSPSDLEKLNAIDNVSYRHRNRLCSSVKAAKSNPDEIPYTSVEFVKKKLSPVPVWTYRGCSFSCSFCDRKFMHGDRLKVRSIDSVIKELKILSKHFGVSNIVFDDCNFVLNRKRALALCRAIVSNKIKINWTCSTRVEQVDGELLRAMRSAGCKMIYYGIESGSPLILNKIGKAFSAAECVKAVRMAKILGFRVGLFLMIGCPGETKKTIKETKSLLHSLYPFDDLNVNPLLVLPGTALYRELLSKKKIASDHFFKKDGPFYYFKNWSGVKKELRPFLKFFEVCPK